MKTCILCGSPCVERHHVYYAAGNRKQSEKYGCIEYICHNHHNEPPSGVHFDKAFDLELKQKHQRILEEKGMAREEFRKIFGRSYLE